MNSPDHLTAECEKLHAELLEWRNMARQAKAQRDDWNKIADDRKAECERLKGELCESKMTAAEAVMRMREMAAALAQANEVSERFKSVTICRRCGEYALLGDCPNCLKAHNAALLELLRSCRGELENLQTKLANKEVEGWEGSKRRCVLKQAIDSAIALEKGEK